MKFKLPNKLIDFLIKEDILELYINSLTEHVKKNEFVFHIKEDGYVDLEDDVNFGLIDYLSAFFYWDDTIMGFDWWHKINQKYSSYLVDIGEEKILTY